MTECIEWASDDFLLRQEFIINDPGPGQPRVAQRGSAEFMLAPRCRCEYCPQVEHPNYIRTQAA